MIIYYCMRMTELLHFGLNRTGLIDEKEYDILLHLIESKMKGLWHTPSYMTPRRPEMVVAGIYFHLSVYLIISYCSIYFY